MTRFVTLFAAVLFASVAFAPFGFAQGQQSAPPEDPRDQQIRDLRAEIILLNAQIKKLTADLEAAKAAQGKPASPEATQGNSADDANAGITGEKCPVCHGNGEVVCTHCQHTGRQMCDMCKGMGRIPCPNCKGHPQLTVCNACQGTGKITQEATDQIRYFSVPCDKCSGRGKFNPCLICAGQDMKFWGTINCPQCQGNRWYGICQWCQGTFRMPCPKCSSQSAPTPTP